MQKQISYKGSTAIITIKAYVRKGDGKRTYSIMTESTCSGYKHYCTEVQLLNEDILMSFESSFQNWVNSKDSLVTESLLEDNGYSKI